MSLLPSIPSIPSIPSTLYEKYTTKELVETCKEKGITGYSSKSKAALIQLLLKHTVSAPQEASAQSAQSEQSAQYHVVNAFEYLEKDDQKYRCIYLDPPYASGRDYKFAEQDTKAVFTDKFTPKQYHAWLNQLVTLCAARLTDDGTLWFHIAAEYSFVPEQILRTHFKEVEKNFWKKSHGKNTVKTKMGAVVDVLFRCYNAPKPVFHLQYVPLDEYYFEHSYRSKDERGQYALGSLRFDKTRSGNHYDMIHEGVTYSSPYGWKIQQQKMEELIKDNRIHFVSANEKRAANLYKKLYKSECKGKPLSNFWDDIEFQGEPLANFWDDTDTHHDKGQPLSNFWDDISYITHTQKDPRTYPTQKPLKLLQRILEISTNQGDWVLDPTAGSGTTGVAAKSLGRHCCLLDINPDGRDIFMSRIKNVKEIDIDIGENENEEEEEEEKDSGEPKQKKQKVI